MGLRLKAEVNFGGPKPAPMEGFGMFGFDNVKKKHVATWVDTTSTALISAEGVVVDPSGKTVVCYGSLDEYMTGEHDKAVRHTRKRISDDQWVLEIWDLGIGELGAVVLRETFTRVKK
jgi:hypothetical protein